MDPLIISAALQAVTTIINQIAVYNRGQMTDAEVEAFHQHVLAYMRAVQADADTLR